MGEKITDDRGGDLQCVGFYGGVEGDGERAGTRGEVFAPESDYRGGGRRGQKRNCCEKKAPKKAKAPAEPVVLKCPKCGNGEIIKGRAAWGCSLYRKSCDFIIPMEFFGKKLTQKQVEVLVLKGKTGSLNGFKNEDGSTFGGILRLDDSFRVVVDKK